MIYVLIIPHALIRTFPYEQSSNTTLPPTGFPSPVGLVGLYCYYHMFKKMKEIGKIKRRGKTKGQVGHGHFGFLFNFSHFFEVLEMHEMSIFQLAKLSALSM